MVPPGTSNTTHPVTGTLPWYVEEAAALQTMDGEGAKEGEGLGEGLGASRYKDTSNLYLDRLRVGVPSADAPAVCVSRLDTMDNTGQGLATLNSADTWASCSMYKTPQKPEGRPSPTTSVGPSTYHFTVLTVGPAANSPVTNLRFNVK